MFNEEQQKAIETIKGQLILVACPGSGKTTTLLGRIHEMIQQGVPAENILMVTFTTAAAGEMKQRFWKKYAEDGMVTFCTIHSFCLATLKKFAHFDAECVLATGDIYEFFFQQLVRHKEIVDKVEYIKALLLDIAVCKNSMCPLAQFEPNCGEKELFDELFKAYENWKDALGKIDYDDMLLKAYELMKNDKTCLEWLQERYQYIQIDEFQDTNYLQRDILYLLAGENGNIAVVGDDDQSIYGFRGAKPEIMLKFAEHYPNAVSLHLSTNYRSDRKIIECASNLIHHNKERFDKEFLASHEEEGIVHHQTYNDIDAEQRGLVKMILEKKMSMEEYRNTSILYRTNKEAVQVSDLLITEKIPFWCTEPIQDKYDHWIYRDILSYHKLGNGIGNKMDLNRILNHPQTRYTAPTAEEEWTLDPEIPVNYLPVAGEDEVYMVLDDSGNIVGYRHRTQQEDGSWLWTDIEDPNAEHYEKVDGLDHIYKVTDKDGTSSYQQYVRNEDGSYAYVPVNENGVPLDDGADATTIDTTHYVHKSGNVYGLYNDNGVLTGYRERVKDGENYVWKVTDPPKSSTSDLQEWSEAKKDNANQGDLSADSGDGTQNSGNNGVIVGGSGAESSQIDNGDGTYTKTETNVSTKTEDGYCITYKTTVTSVYDTNGTLISTQKDGPYEVSREKLNVSEDPSAASAADTIDAEVARVSGKVSYDTTKAAELLAKLNADRASAGLGQLQMNTNSLTYKLAVLKAADMAIYDYSSDDSPLYGTLSELAQKYGGNGDDVSENIWKVSVKSADEIDAKFQSNEGSRGLRMSTGYTQVGIAIVEKNNQDYIAEVYLE